MRRVVTVCSLAVVVASPFAVTYAGASTAHKPQLVDPQGDQDFPLASMDIASVALSTSSGNLVVAMRLSAAPTPGEPAQYLVSFAFPGCDEFDVIYQYNGATGIGSDASYTEAGSCKSAGALVAPSDLSDVPASVKDDFIVWKLPLAGALRLGARITGLSAHTSSGVNVNESGARTYVGTPVGDDLSGGSPYVIGQ